MRVLHLSTFDIRGGAARGAYWLHRAMMENGIDSRMLVGRKYSDDAEITELREPFHRVIAKLRGDLDVLPLRRYRKTDESFWSVGWLPNRVDRAVAEHAPDVVHVHWTGGGFMSVRSMHDLPYPVVWTLRDMWAFTGGCHYTAGCERYAEACGACPQLQSDKRDDLSRDMWHRKAAAWQHMDLSLVPISSWLADCVRDSRMFGDETRVEVIPNGIDTSVFRPFDRAASKAEWQLPDHKRHVLFGAVGATDDARKGFHHIVEAVRILSNSGWSDTIELVVFGGAASDELAETGLPIRSVGNIDDDNALAKLYSACDVMVVPSEQEAFGKTLVEAMACSTPVVAFACGGPLDIVEHQRSGFLAEPFSARSLADGIVWCVEKDDRKARLGRYARTCAEREFDIHAVADRYCSLYQQILSEAA